MTRTQGFTLPEMLVALTVASILMLGLFGTVGYMGKSTQRNEERLNADMAAFTAFALFEKDVLSYAGNIRAPHPFELQFDTLRAPQAGQHGSGRVNVLWRIEPQGDGSARVLRQEVDTLFASQNLMTEVATVMGAGFIVRARSGLEVSPWQDKSAPPAALALTLTTQGGYVWTRTVPLLVRTP
jgi:prepilin-type N-terminal cleavage/methylation domain-containing protein